MTKDVIFAGLMAVGCLALVLVAILAQPTAKRDQSLNIAEAPIAPGQPDSFTSPILQNSDGGFPVPPAPAPMTMPVLPVSGPVVTPHLPLGPLPSPIAPTPEPTPIVTAVTGAQTHVVAEGETLGEISQHYYGTSKQWKAIQKANAGVDPSNLQKGTKLTIPPLEKTEAAPAPVAGPGERTYTLKSGDTYYTVAKAQLGNASRWNELLKLNGIPAEELRPGRVIKLPAKANAVVAVAPEAPVAGNVHVVGSGDTLAEISQKHYGTTKRWKEILKANPGIDPEGLKVGQKVVLPDLPANTAVEKPAPASDDGATYTVKANDTFQVIAQSQLGDGKQWKKIQALNPGVESSNLRIGQKLKMPAKTDKKSASGDAAPVPERLTPQPNIPAPAPTTPLFPTAGPAPGRVPVIAPGVPAPRLPSAPSGLRPEDFPSH